MVIDANMTEPVVEDTESSADKEDRKRIVKNLKETKNKNIKKLPIKPVFVMAWERLHF